MRSLHLAALLLAGTASAPAFAQETEQQPYSGFYVGGSIGFTAQRSNAGERILFDRDLNGTFGDTVTTFPTGSNAFSPGFCNGTANGNAPAAGCDTDRDDVEYFGRVGFDAQFGQVVAGVVGEVGHTNATSSVSAFSTTPASYTMTREMDYNANLRARLGYVFGPSTLVYGTGGIAYAKLDSSFTTTNTANTFTLTEQDNDVWGYTAGAGLEQLIGRNISFGLEYIYSRFKDDNFNVRVGRGTAAATNPFLIGSGGGTDFRRSFDRFSLHSIRAVLNFRF
jgi:outer membrane immunogenic protein